MCAMSSTGQFAYKIVPRGNKETFEDFLINNVINNFDQKTLLMDNVRVSPSS